MIRKNKIIFQGSVYYEKDNMALNAFLNQAKRYGWRVSVLLDRTYELLFIINRLFESGITFVPIDPELPPARIKHMVTDSKTDYMISQKKYESILVDMNVFYTDKDTQIKDGLRTCSDEQSLAYILYTSGSTGIPKGVEITRESLLNFIEGISEIIDFKPTKRIACLTTVSFDIFFLESIVAFYKGISVVLASADEQRNPKLMAQLISDNDVDMLQMTPSRMQLLLNHDKELSCLKNVKVIMIGGESFPLTLLRTLQEKTKANIYNMYGPTETTIWSTVSDLTNKSRIDIGRPIKETEVYIVDENLNLAVDGQYGEICITGKGLARGYIGRDDLTAEKFIYLPQKRDVRVYRTGDIGRYLPDGDLEYLGRADNQIKLRGYRIELEEIEFHLNQFDGIKQSVVIARETSETDKILEAFYTSENHIDIKDITDYLAIKLPSYMIPVAFKRIENFIQTANGKIDRKRVLECIEVNAEVEMVRTSNVRTETQKKALDIILSSMDERFINNVSMDSDFTTIGLDSITFIKIVVSLESEFDFEFDDDMLIVTKFPNIKTMVEYVDSKTARRQ